MRRLTSFTLSLNLLKLALLASLLLGGCVYDSLVSKSRIVDATKDNVPQPIPVPEGIYGSMAWLADDQIAFRYRSNPEELVLDTEIVLYQLHTSEWQTLPFDKSEECLSSRLGSVARLPNDNLGFTHRCQFEAGEGFEVSLYMWDVQTETLHILFTYPKLFGANDFSFAPDMSEWLQEESGDGIFNELYRVQQDGQIERLFPGYYRAGSPSWSPDGKTIAFAATEEGPEEETNIFSGLPGLAGAMYYPWNIYLMDANGDNVRVILSDVVTVHIVKWSPQGNLLAFWGEYEGTDGIWLLEPGTSQLTRIWPEKTAFDWSPDGRQMVLLEREKRGDETFNKPVIIDVTLGE